MGKIGKISPLKKEYSNAQGDTMETGLAKKGLTRIPGTGVFKFPYKELDGKYRTGIDPDAAYIKRISDPLQKDLEIQRVTELRDRIQESLGDIDLGPRSQFWNYAMSRSQNDAEHVQPYKLIDGVNLFDLDNPSHELTFAWLRVHPTIASSYQAWERGEYPADTQFYVEDEEIENAIIYKKKQLINKAIIKFDQMSPEKKRKIARLLGLPVTDNTKEEIVYNQVDTILKQTEFQSGAFKGMNPITVFNQFADMQESLLHVKDLVEQAISHSIYRVQAGGRIFEGQVEVGRDKDEIVKYLINEDHQEDLIILEQKIKGKKLAAI